VTPESGHFLDKARKLLVEADAMLKIQLNDAAGRSAYLAGFHAAQAYIFENPGRATKTHKGVHSELQRLTRNDPHSRPACGVFQSKSYNLKAIADYETGPGSEISPERPSAAVQEAKCFVGYFESMLTSQSFTGEGTVKDD
jgi:uncharacterized protein (UPF0332 family)